MRSEGVERATAAVFVMGTRAGSAVLVDRRHALTARHVTGFPAAGVRVPAVTVDAGEGLADLDVALLELRGELPAGIAVPE
jgi:hypothetical protein